MYEICMRYKCKNCPQKLDCDTELKEFKKNHLVFRPFENLPQILKEKGIKVW